MSAPSFTYDVTAGKKLYSIREERRYASGMTEKQVNRINYYISRAKRNTQFYYLCEDLGISPILTRIFLFFLGGGFWAKMVVRLEERRFLL